MLENLQGLLKRRCWDSAKHGALQCSRSWGKSCYDPSPCWAAQIDSAQASCSSQHDCLGNKQNSVFSAMLKNLLIKASITAGVCLFQRSGRNQSWFKVRAPAPALGLASVSDQSCSDNLFRGFKISQHPEGLSPLGRCGNRFRRILISGSWPLPRRFCLSSNTALS